MRTNILHKAEKRHISSIQVTNYCVRHYSNRAGETAQWVKHLLCKHEDPSWEPGPMQMPKGCGPAPVISAHRMHSQDSQSKVTS